MAIILDGTGDTLYANNSVVGMGNTITLSAHFYLVAKPVGLAPVSVLVPAFGGGNYGFYWACHEGDGGGGVNAPQIFYNPTGGQWRYGSNGAVATGTWYYGVVTANLNTTGIPRVWQDGVELSTYFSSGDLNAPPAATHDSWGVGTDYAFRADSTPNIRIAHAAIWNTVLSDAECVALSKGISPMLVRKPTAYLPLFGDARELIQGLSFTDAGNATYGQGPRVFLPSAPAARSNSGASPITAFQGVQPNAFQAGAGGVLRPQVVPFQADAFQIGFRHQAPAAAPVPKGAFQQDAFQGDAFQEGGGAPVPPEEAAGTPPHVPSEGRRRRLKYDEAALEALLQAQIAQEDDEIIKVIGAFLEQGTVYRVAA